MNNKQKEMIEDLTAKRYWLHEKFYEIEKYIETVEESQNIMIKNDLEEEMFCLLPKETLEIVKQNIIKSKNIISKLRK